MVTGVAGGASCLRTVGVEVVAGLCGFLDDVFGVVVDAAGAALTVVASSCVVADGAEAGGFVVLRSTGSMVERRRGTILWTRT
jgi:hypothetical protein